MESTENSVDAESDVEICIVDEDYDDVGEQDANDENNSEETTAPSKSAESCDSTTESVIDIKVKIEEEISVPNMPEIESKNELPEQDVDSGDNQHGEILDEKKADEIKTFRDFIENDANRISAQNSERKIINDMTNEKIENQSSDSEDIDEDDEDNDDIFSRFYFESDHLAYKHNKDYKNLLKTLISLEAARTSSVKDLEELQIWKEKALKDPISFIESLQSKDPPKLPSRKQITALPTIDWMQYLTASDLMKYENGFQVNTRRSFRSKGEASSQDDRVKTETGTQDDSESVISDSSMDQTKFVRGRMADESKVMTFNRLWTTEEQEKLEKLLQIYPPEDIEARRWEKIARALGNRTPKQVSSRVQKYFIKLARAGLPIPGRVPHLTSQRKSKINPVSYRNSTFFPSWKPSVYMNDDDDDEASSVTTLQSDDTPCVSDEEMIPSDLKESVEYKELMNLKRLRKECKEATFQCSSCGVKPIRGTRWYCSNCPEDVPFHLCGECYERNQHVFSNTHAAWHRMVQVEKNSSFVDGDYTNFELQQGKYNYLDPNFNPNPR